MLLIDAGTLHGWWASAKAYSNSTTGQVVIFVGTPLVGLVLTRWWKELLFLVGIDIDGPKPWKPGEAWPPDRMAEILQTADFKGDLLMSAGRHLAVLVAECLQGEPFKTDKITPEEWSRFRSRYNIPKRATAVEYMTQSQAVTIRLEGASRDNRKDVICELDLAVRFSDEKIERVLTLKHVDGHCITVDDVRKALAQVAEPWLRARIPECDFEQLSKRFNPVPEELEQALKEKCASHGLELDEDRSALICRFTSAGYEQEQAKRTDTELRLAKIAAEESELAIKKSEEASRIELARQQTEMELAARKAEAEARAQVERMELAAKKAESEARLEKERQLLQAELAARKAALELETAVAKTRVELEEVLRELERKSVTGKWEHDSLLEEAQKRLKHQADLNEWERLKELEEKKEWILRKKQEAPPQEEQRFQEANQTMSNQTPRDSHETARQEILRRLETLRSRKQPFSLDLQTARTGAATRDIGVGLRHSHERMEIGDFLKLRIRSARSGYLSIFNLGTSGAVTLLYPNQYHPDSRIEANREILIPAENDRFELPVLGPPGRELIQAYVTSRPLSVVTRPDDPDSVFVSWEPAVASRNIGVVAKELNASEEDSWAEAALTIEVPPQRTAARY